MNTLEQEWSELHRAYKRRFADAKLRGVRFSPTDDEKEAHCRYGANYASTERGRAILQAGHRKYRQSEHGRLARDTYNHSEARKISAAKYAGTPKGRLVSRKAKAKYRGHAAPEHVDLDWLVSQQSGRCAICGTIFTNSDKPCLDHCHETGVVRGALCGDCNLGIGLFDDNAERLTRAASYVVPPTETR